MKCLVLIFYHSNYVPYSDWIKIMKREDENGVKRGKPREKFLWTQDYEDIIGRNLR